MSGLRRKRRRGAALIVALGALVVMTVTVASLARVASTASIARTTAGSKAIADELLLECSRPIERWLTRDADLVVLPIDAREPRIEVLHDRIQHGGLDVEVALTAFDLCGMVPIEAAQRGSPLRSTLPDVVLRAIDVTPLPRDGPLGLDLFPETKDGLSLYPVTSPRAPIALGGTVAMRRTKRARLNAATAPLSLLEAALRLRGRGGIELIREARARGERPNLGANSASPEESAIPEVALGSDAFAFRIDVRAGSLRRSWWETYERESASWHRVQRLAVAL